MTSIPENRRGIGNALRSTIQNGAGVAGTAFVVAMTASTANQYTVIFIILAVACTAATVVSLTRPSTTDNS